MPLLLILVEKDMGTAASLAVAGFGVMYVAGVRWWLILGSLVAGAFVLYATTTSSPNRMLRIYAWEHPEKYSLGAGRQQWLSMLAFSHGGIKGAGLGEGVQKHGNLPFAHTDFIFAEIGEELGFVGAMGLSCCFLCWRSEALLWPSRRAIPSADYWRWGLLRLFSGQRC